MKSAADRRPSGVEPLYQRCCTILSRRSLKYLKWAVVLTSPVLMISAILFASRHLAYVDSPRQSDAVILFVGPDYEARLREARQLIADGYAGHLLIPAFNQILKTDSSGALPSPQRIENTAAIKRRGNQRGRFYENTHTEVLVARQMMEQSNFRTAIFVSSPYHMRRIKLIAERVFKTSPAPLSDPTSEEGAYHQFPPFVKRGKADLDSTASPYGLSFVPSRYESVRGIFWFATYHDFRWVFSEYMKIAWFRLYSCFAPDPAYEDSTAL